MKSPGLKSLRCPAWRKISRQQGAAAVEFALVLPILLLIIFAILDFGLYFFNDLQLTHAARDAARYLSVNKLDQANAAIDKVSLISATITKRVLDPGTTGNEAKVTLQATYRFLTPLPNLLPRISGGTLGINATAVMRRE